MDAQMKETPRRREAVTIITSGRFCTATVLDCGVICVLTAGPAYAYVDPGTGGMLVQLVTGGIAGVIILARLYWRRLKDSVTRSSTGSEPIAPETKTPDRPH